MFAFPETHGQWSSGKCPSANTLTLHSYFPLICHLFRDHPFHCCCTVWSLFLVQEIEEQTHWANDYMTCRSLQLCISTHHHDKQWWCVIGRWQKSVRIKFKVKTIFVNKWFVDGRIIHLHYCNIWELINITQKTQYLVVS